MHTDDKRLQQVIKNLLSNAFKFTEQGRVTLQGRARAERLEPDQRPPQQRRPGARLLRHRHRHRHPRGQAAHHLRGLPAGRRHHQPQVRRHRPGPSISREIARLLGGEIVVVEPARQGLDLHPLPAARAAGDDRGGRSAAACAPGRQRLGHGAASASVADGAVGLRRRPRRHRRRRSRGADRRGRRRASPRSCSSWRASRASRA